MDADDDHSQAVRDLSDEELAERLEAARLRLLEGQQGEPAASVGDGPAP